MSAPCVTATLVAWPDVERCDDLLRAEAFDVAQPDDGLLGQRKLSDHVAQVLQGLATEQSLLGQQEHLLAHSSERARGVSPACTATRGPFAQAWRLPESISDTLRVEGWGASENDEICLIPAPQSYALNE